MSPRSRCRFGFGRRSMLVGLALCAGSILPAAASGQSWLNPVDGSWSDGNKWSGGSPPNSGTTTATLGFGVAYSVGLSGGFTVGNLSITNPLATLGIANNSILYIGGAAPFDVTSNAGTVLINPATIENVTSLALNATHTFTGSGRLTLNAHPNNLDTARIVRNAADPLFINGFGHTVNGSGHFNDISISNAGRIDASVTDRYLQLYGRATSNTGLLTASAGWLQLNTTTINQSGAGQITATGAGQVRLVNAAVNGGSIVSPGTGRCFIVPGYSAAFDGVTLSGPFEVMHNCPLYVNANGMTVNGVLTVNPAPIENITSIAINVDQLVTIGGSGTIVLNAHPNNNDTARFIRTAAIAAVAIGPNLTVRGAGNFNDINVVNNGVINADTPGRTLQLYSHATTNNNLLTATNGGILQVNAQPLTNNAGGRLVADGASSIVNLINGSVTGGLISGVNGGSAQLPPSIGFTLSGVTLTGPFNIYQNSLLALTSPGLVNNGTLTVNTPGIENVTSIRSDSDDLPITGNGTIALNAHVNNLDTARFVRGSGTASFVFGPNTTIRGTGQFNDVGFTNNGVINADITGRTLQFYSRSSTNNNLMTATNGGVLQVNAHTVTNIGNGRLVADGAGSTINLINGLISGGAINATNGGVAQLVQSTGFTLDGVTTTGTFNILQNSLLAITTAGIVNNGTLTVNSPGIENITSIRADGDNVPLNGAGTIVLNSHINNIDTARFIRNTGTASFVIGPNMTIRGTGQFNDVGFTNNGVINADRPGRTLQLYNRASTNNNLMTATNGGILQITAETVTNNGGASLVADGTGSTINLINGAVVGGSINAVNGGVAQIPASVGFTLYGVTVNGPFNIFNNATLGVPPEGIINNGIITLNLPAIENITQFTATGDNVPITGNGTVFLNANLNNIDTARLIRSTGTASYLFGPAQTLAGTGQVNDVALECRGTLAPGAPGAGMSFGRINFVNRPLTLASTSIYRAQIGGPPATGAYDRLTGNSPVTLDGTLVVTVDPAYAPTRGDRFDIIFMGARTGRFAAVQLPSSPNGVWKYAYLNNGVRVGFACNAADPAGLGGVLGPDGGFTADDLIVFLDGFFNNDLAIADVAGLGGTVGADGRLTVDDIIVFLAAFFAGCSS